MFRKDSSLRKKNTQPDTHNAKLLENIASVLRDDTPQKNTGTANPPDTRHHTSLSAENLTHPSETSANKTSLPSNHPSMIAMIAQLKFQREQLKENINQVIELDKKIKTTFKRVMVYKPTFFGENESDCYYFCANEIKNDSEKMMMALTQVTLVREAKTFSPPAEMAELLNKFDRLQQEMKNYPDELKKVFNKMTGYYQDYMKIQEDALKNPESFAEKTFSDHPFLFIGQDKKDLADAYKIPVVISSVKKAIGDAKLLLEAVSYFRKQVFKIFHIEEKVEKKEKLGNDESRRSSPTFGANRS